jgi:hydrophobe/amphiphile efflux-1 (HAE1) family protein
VVEAEPARAGPLLKPKPKAEAMSKFFLHRPVFAWVIAIAMMLGGGLAIYKLPISQYPPIAPPSISITAVYPGASAKTVEDSVVQIIEQKMTGLDRMLYMSATSDSSGSAQLILTFAPDTDPDLAWSKVQNKLQLAMPMLPSVVQQQGVTVAKSTRNYLLLVGLVSDSASVDDYDLTDYSVSKVQASLARVPGVGEVEAFGSQYAMRVWMDPNKLTQYNMTSDDIIAGIRAYNVQVSAGQFGGAPAVPGQRLNASIVVQSLLKTPEEFGAIPLRDRPDGSIVRVRDVARTELGTEFYDVGSKFNGRPASGLAIRQEPGANALDTAAAVKAKMQELSRSFPAGMRVVYPYDTTPFVRVAIGEVVRTLIEAIILVFLIMYLFLGNMRATLVPTIAVPVVILGTFGVLAALGFSINMLTMFAMVLAIGLLVDDAIVVVENVERVMSEEGLPPWEATRKSMDEITGALVGIGFVLSAVFAPMIFFPGSTGIIYRQFSVTVIASMLLSVLVALILTPVLCASLLKPVTKGHEAAESGFRLLRPFFLGFDRAFNFLRDKYQSLVGRILGNKAPSLLAFVLIVVAMGFLFHRMPTAYLPDEDQGMLMSMVQLPPGATREQTDVVLDKVQRHFLEDQKEAVESCMTVAGYSMAGRGQNQGMSFIMLRDWKLRDRPDLKVKAVAGKAMQAFSGMRNAVAFAFPPPAVIELGNATGFDFMLQDRGGLGHEKLMAARRQVLELAAKDPRLVRVRPNGLDDVPEYRSDVDWEKAGTWGVPISNIHSTISAAFGSAYVNDFIQGGRVKRVYVQADAPYRMLPSDLERLYVRNNKGGMVPVSALASGRWIFDSPRLERFNSFPALNFQGEPAPGRSSGEAMQAMEEIVAKLPQGIGYDWTGLSYQERMGQAQTGLLYSFSILVIFLVLAALYESWTVPISIMLALPLGVIGGVLATSYRGLPNDVYFQIGLLTVLGLTTKNAILIVQFAKARREEGMGLIEATLEGAKLRLRPIIMTSLAFGFGVLPLAFATGAGAGAQKAIGTAVLGGVVTSTFLVTIFAPLFYVLIEKISVKTRPPEAAKLEDRNRSEDE